MERAPRYTFDRRLGGEEKKSLPMPGIESQFSKP